jgi:nucleoside-diphosphate-sugar epimerase
MRVFVTGATGFVGSAVVKDLIGAGYKVLGLVRSDANAKALADAGGEVHRGSLQDIESLKSGAAACDGVIHTAFIHDFTNYAENGQVDKRAIEAMGAVLAGSDRPLIVTSGTALVAPGRVATEDMRADGAAASMRLSEQTADAVARQHGVRSMSIRLAPTVHGKGDHGFVPQMVNIAREKGMAVYVGDGTNRWTAVHRLDAATLYRLALEKGKAGAIYHGVAEEGVAIKDIAAVIGKRLNVPFVSKTAEEAQALLGFIGMIMSLDIPASSVKTQQELGWKPKGAALLADLEEHYFA